MSEESRVPVRCSWATSSAAMSAYHDLEWGVRSRDETHLFEMLVLEGAQAGLSWSTILVKRDNYRRAFDGFDPETVARYGEAKIEDLLGDAGIVRNRLKIRSTVTNAQMFLRTKEEFGTFASYVWSWVDDKPVVHHPKDLSEVPARDQLSDRVSKDLKQRGFMFVGSTIVYSYLQSVGVVNDHVVNCEWRRAS